MVEKPSIVDTDGTKKWLPGLWGRLMKIRQTRESELNEIKKIMCVDPVELAKYYIEPDCQEKNPADRHEDAEKRPIKVVIDEFLSQKTITQEPGSNTLFVMSDAGMGKSALLAMIKYTHLTAFWPQRFNCVLKQLGSETLGEIKAAENERKTILLLDSLDEDPETVGRIHDRLMEILDATKHFFKVIVTCRTQFFPKTERGLLELPGQICIEGFSCSSTYLSFFDDDKVLQYLKKRFPSRLFGLWKNQKIAEAKKIIDLMGSLKFRPMLLSYIGDLMKSPLMKKGGNEYDIYEVLVKIWLNREKTKPKEISESDQLDACIILATWMQIRRKREINEKSICQIIKARPVTQLGMQGRSLLNRNSDGEYRFSHYCLQEFCVAKFLVEEPLFDPDSKVPVTMNILHLMDMSGKFPLSPDLIEIKDSSQSEKVQKRITNTLGMSFVYIPPGVFMMGSQGMSESETLHAVVLTNGFYMQTTQVTQATWCELMGDNPSSFIGESRPVENVSWDDAQKFMLRLKELEEVEYRLPTEAEWEYSCRSGSDRAYGFGDDTDLLDDYSWYGRNSDGKTHPVGAKKPNVWGLFDMHGNVSEWCLDWHGEYPKGTVTDPTGPEKGTHRVVRGGAWCDNPELLRCAYRSAILSDIRFDDVGFRVVRVSPQRKRRNESIPKSAVKSAPLWRLSDF